MVKGPTDLTWWIAFPHIGRGPGPSRWVLAALVGYVQIQSTVTTLIEITRLVEREVVMVETAFGPLSQVDSVVTACTLALHPPGISLEALSDEHQAADGLVTLVYVL